VSTPNHSTETENAVALAAGMKLADVKTQSMEANGTIGRAYAFVPEGVKPVDLSLFMPFPDRVRESPKFPNLLSFVQYVNRFKTDDTVIFASDADDTLDAVIDYHGPAQPRHGEHVPQLVLKKSEEWLAWMQYNGRALSQEALGDFLELRELDILSPDSSKILAAARDLKLSKDCAFESKVNVVNGSAVFHYAETVTERNELKLPVEWVLSLRPYQHCDPVQVQVKVRYRLQGKSIALTYQLVRPEKVLEAAFANVVEKVRDGLKTVPVYVGSQG
jgi:uncharacterized protein YfdQ (DUF2303 family)